MALLTIFGKAHYGLLAIGVAALVFASIILGAQARFLAGIFFDSGIPLVSAFYLTWSVLYGAVSEFSATTAFAAVIALLFGMNVAAITYYVRLYRATAVSAVAALGTGGVLSGILAVGCLSCGSLALAFLSSFFSASSLLIFIPYQSAVFGLISILLLALSLYLLDRKLRLAFEYSRSK